MPCVVVGLVRPRCDVDAVSARGSPSLTTVVHVAALPRAARAHVGPRIAALGLDRECRVRESDRCGQYHSESSFTIREDMLCAFSFLHVVGSYQKEKMGKHIFLCHMT